MRSLGWKTGSVGLVLALSLVGCSSDDSPDEDATSGASADGSSAAEETEAPVDGCETPVPKSDLVLEVTVETAEEALTAAEIEPTSVDVRTGSADVCLISWEDDGKGGLVTLTAQRPGSNKPADLPGSAPIGDWTCVVDNFGGPAGAACATEGIDLILLMEPGSADGVQAALEVLLPTLA